MQTISGNVNNITEEITGNINIGNSRIGGEVSKRDFTIPVKLEHLEDVNITAPNEGEVLKWNGTEWVNGEGATIEVDDAISDTSENPVQNKVIKQALDNIEIDVDDALSDTSENPVQNKVITEALNNVHIDVDSALSTTSENPVQNKIITAEINNLNTDLAQNTDWLQHENLFIISEARIDKMINSDGSIVSDAGTFVTNDIFVKGGTTVYIGKRGTTRWGYFDVNMQNFVFANSSDESFTMPYDGYLRLSVVNSITPIEKYRVEAGGLSMSNVELTEEVGDRKGITTLKSSVAFTKDVAGSYTLDDDVTKYKEIIISITISGVYYPIIQNVAYMKLKQGNSIRQQIFINSNIQGYVNIFIRNNTLIDITISANANGNLEVFGIK